MSIEMATDQPRQERIRYFSMKVLTAAAFCILVTCGTLLAQQPREKPKEIEVLGRYVGDWTSDVTSKRAVWTPAEKQFRTSNHAEFVLDGWFLHHIEINNEVANPNEVVKSLFFWTFDPQTEMYTKWLFQSSGVIGKWAGTWNAKDKVLAATTPEPPPNTTGKFTESFPNEGTINGTLVFTGDDGRTLFDMVWTRTRQKVLVPNPLKKQWAEIGTPINPIPAEMKRMELFIGQWDAQFISRPSALSPRGRTTKGEFAAQWILDGRFLLGTTEMGNHRSMWVMGYDTNKNTYRYIRFTNGGLTDESTGKWNEETRSLVWKLVNAPAGITRTSTTRFVGKEGIHSHIVAENREGKVHMDLTITGTRRK